VRVGDAVRRAGTPAMDRAVSATTDLGSVYAVVGVAATLAVAGRRRTALDVLGLGGAAWAVAQGSKTRVRRQRPYETDGVRRLVRPPTGSSFPSGHAAVGAAIMSLLAERSDRRGGRLLLAGLAGYVPLSRVYVGVHYPTDVIGGAGLGVLLAALWRGAVAAIPRAGILAALRRARAVVRS
jgi:undecaprenyl-diphosphatase